MDYKKFGETIYARFDKGDEVLEGILNICKKDNILSATFSGIGGCGDVTVSLIYLKLMNFCHTIKKDVYWR